MSFDDMTDYVLHRTAIERRAEAVHWLQETLTAFAKCLTPSEAQRLALELPAPASLWIRGVEHECMLGRPEELYALVQRHLASTLGVAVERTQVAIAAMARALRAETLGWLARRMGEPWQDLLEEPCKPAPKSQRSREQSGSVAERNPHEDRKISSAKDTV